MVGEEGSGIRMKSHYELSRGVSLLSSHFTLAAGASAAREIMANENPCAVLRSIGSSQLDKFSLAMLAHNLSICESTIRERSPDPEIAIG